MTIDHLLEGDVLIMRHPPEADLIVRYIKQAADDKVLVFDGENKVKTDLNSVTDARLDERLEKHPDHRLPELVGFMIR